MVSTEGLYFNAYYAYCCLNEHEYMTPDITSVLTLQMWLILRQI